MALSSDDPRELMKPTPRVRYASYGVSWAGHRYQILAPENATVAQLVALARSVLHVTERLTVFDGGRVLGVDEAAPREVTFVSRER